jgi:hypothetical protein
MLLLSFCLALIMSATQVQQPSILDSFRQKSAQECLSVDYEFATITSGLKTTGEGTVEIQGNSYHMCGNGIEIYCDGLTTWMIDDSTKEVFIEAADSQSAGYLANPVILLMNLEESSGSCKVDGNRIALELAGGISMEIFVNGIETVPTKKTEAFRPPMKFDSTWIVTDLR